MALPLDRFVRHHELVEALHGLAADAPGLVTVDEIGRSHEGRELLLVTVTDAATGPHHDKPAHWVDASIHAVELTGTVAALHLLHHLVEGFGRDERVTRALATRSFYVMPRVNPDGAEAVLADEPRLLRSSVRAWPWPPGTVVPGLRIHDVDGDGRLCQMRLPDPNGAWKPHPDEPRLLVHRAPDDGPGDGPFYRLLAEGTVEDHDGFTIPTPRPPEGLDLNRNYPAGWATKVTGAGDFPGSEPEIQALLRAITGRPNICGANSYHTFGGVLLRPSSVRADADLPPVDVWTWKHLGARGTELTGFPAHSVYEEYTWDRGDLMSGASDDWAYEHLGVYSWTTEFWDPIRRATGEHAPSTVWVEGPSNTQELAVLRWCEQHQAGALFVDWQPFDHPQLGPVEIGGWDALRSWANPPADLLAAEVAGHPQFAVYQALAAPCLELVQVVAEPLGDDAWRVSAGIANTGWLPTTVSERAKHERLVLPIVAEVTVPERGTVLGGPARVELGQLAGRSGFHLDGFARNDGTPDRVLASWVVRVPGGGAVTVEARHQRAGRVRTTVTLP